MSLSWRTAFGWFDGGGWDGAMAYFDSKGIPHALGIVVVLTESVGAAALINGVLTRLAALAIGCEMVVAALLIHLPHGFFMDWHGAHHGEGYEFHILALAMASALVLSGGGAFCLDRVLTRALGDAGVRPDVNPASFARVSTVFVLLLASASRISAHVPRRSPEARNISPARWKTSAEKGERAVDRRGA